MDRLRCLIFQATFVLCLFAGLLAGCATLPIPTRSDRVGEAGPFGGCADFFSSLDKRTEEAGVLDPGVFRVKKYPYLRVNRFIASFRDEVDNKTGFAAWTDRMQVLDQDARNFEIANLPNSAVAAIDSVNGSAGLYGKVATCGDLLRAGDFQIVDQPEKLRESVSVPHEPIASSCKVRLRGTTFDSRGTCHEPFKRLDDSRHGKPNPLRSAPLSVISRIEVRAGGIFTG